jgi:hypothetical protein
MSRVIFTLMLMLLLCAVISDPARAQTVDRRVQPYTYVGISLPSPEGVGLPMIGGGVEIMVRKDWGVGGEFGYIGTSKPPGKGGFHVAPFVSYHFWRGTTDDFNFFVLGGPAVFILPDRNLGGGFIGGPPDTILPARTTGGLTFGIGMEDWIQKHIGWRLEMRDNFLPKEARHPYSSGRISGHNMGFRISLIFR